MSSAYSPKDDPLSTPCSPLGSTALSTIFTVQAPFIPHPVSLLRSTWDNHILKHHPEMNGKETLVMATVASPTLILPGTSNPDYLIFVNQEELTQKGKPLIAIVNPDHNIIVTSLYNRSYKTVQMESVLWQR